MDGWTPSADFFAAGETEKVVYCASPVVNQTRERLGSVATVVGGGQPVNLRWMCEDLYGRGVRRLMVEGGQSVHTQFLTGDLADDCTSPLPPSSSATRRRGGS